MSQAGSRPLKEKPLAKTGSVEGSPGLKKAPPTGSADKPEPPSIAPCGSPSVTGRKTANNQIPGHPRVLEAKCGGNKADASVNSPVKGEIKVHKSQTVRQATQGVKVKGPARDSPRSSPHRPPQQQQLSKQQLLQQLKQQHLKEQQQKSKQQHVHQHHHGWRGNTASTLEMGIKNMEQVDDDTMIQTVEILKRPGQSLGFYIREGNGLDRCDGVFISRIAPGSVVENNGLLRVGDEIQIVNSVDVSKMGLDDVVILMSIPKRLVLTIRTRKACCKNASCPSLSTLEQEEEPPPVVVVKKGRSSSATAVEMTEKCPDDFQLPGTDPRLYYAKPGLHGPPIYPQHMRGRMRSMDESPYARISDLQYYLSTGARDGMEPPPYHEAMYTGDHPRRSPKMGLKEQPQAVTFRSPRAGRHHISPYQVDYSSDSDTRYLHDRGQTESPYSVPRLPPRTYDPQAVKAFQDEIERSHHRYESMVGSKGRLFKTQRSLSPERYNSDSEILTVYRGRDRDHLERPVPGKDPYITQLVDNEDRCNSMPLMEPTESSEELKHWLKKFDNLSFELQGPSQEKTPPEPSHQRTSSGGTVTSDASSVYTSRPGFSAPQPGSQSDRDSYTSEEYWSWSKHHTSPPGTMSKSTEPTQTTFPRTNRGRPPRVTRKLSTDSLLDYRTYQMEEEPSPDHRMAVRRSPRPMQGHPQGTGSAGGSPHPLIKTRQASMEVGSQMTQSSSVSKMKDLQLGRKPLQIRTDDFRLHQPEMEERKPRVERPMEGLLRVHLYCGHGLKSSRTMLRDLYTVIEVDSLNKARTMIRTGAINFDWDEAFDIELETAQEMCFLVYSWDPNTRHRLCFSGTVALPNLFQYGPYQKIALKLEPKGILYLELDYQEPALTLQRTPSMRKSALFGIDLEMIIRREKSGHNIPVLVKKCVEEVEKRGLDHIGIYRLCGSAKRKSQLKEEFEKNAKAVDLSAEAVSDINVTTGVLKDFLRELPEPLFTNALYQMLLDALSVRLPEDPEGSAKLMLSILECLPKANQDTMAYVLDHLKRVAHKSDVNKMTTQNLAVCFGPVLLCPSPQSVLDAEQALDFKRHIDVLRYLLEIWPHNRDSSLPLSLEQFSIDLSCPPQITLPPSGLKQNHIDKHRTQNETPTAETSGGKIEKHSSPS